MDVRTDFKGGHLGLFVMLTWPLLAQQEDIAGLKTSNYDFVPCQIVQLQKIKCSFTVPKGLHIIRLE